MRTCEHPAPWFHASSALINPPSLCSVRSDSLEMMRELQQQRRRAKGVTLEPKAVLDEVEEALAAGAAAEDGGANNHGLDSTFTSQADSGEVDPNMLKYIEEQMNGGDGDPSKDGEKARSGVLDAEEAELYTTPAHLLGVVPGGGAAQAEESSAQRWLAGITEVEVGVEDKMATIEATEKAKREMMQKMQEKRRRAEEEARRNGHKMEVPGNFGSNFHLHRREFAIKKKEEMGKGKGKGGGRGGGGRGGGRGGEDRGARDLAGDAAAYGRFRANERNFGRR